MRLKSEENLPTRLRPSLHPLIAGGLGALVLSGILAAGWLFNRHGPRPLLEFSGLTQGTTYTIQVAHLAEQVNEETLQAEVEQILARIDQQLSTWREDSEISRFNHNPGTDWITVSPELLFVVKEAQRISRLSGGAFDITIGPVTKLWNFGRRFSVERLPAEVEVREALERVGHEKLETRDDPPALRKTRPDLQIDVSAIAQGYTTDRIYAHLYARGFTDFLVDVGGELRTRGRNSRYQPWTLAIEQPTDGPRTVERLIQVSDKAVSTSGTYRNYFEQDGQRYSHIIDPATGRPVRHELASVTVVADTTALADALATALLVLGPQRGLRLAEQQSLAAFFILVGESGFTELSTAAFEPYLVY